jgi:hypothetical protein
MSIVKTNNISLAYTIESTLGVLPGSPVWKLLEPNDITTFGATITTVAREPIAKDRQRKKGTVTDLESAAEFEHDLTLESFIDFAEGFVFAEFTGVTVGAVSAVTAASDTYTVAAGTALVAEMLIYARGFTNSANNGLYEVVSSTATTIVVGNFLVDETPPDNALIEVAGVRGASDDFAITVTGTTAVLTYAGPVDLTDYITVGQFVHIGGTTAGRQFSAGLGYGRVTAVAAGSLTLDKLSSTLATDPGTGETVDLLFGRFLRNVSVDDAAFLQRSFQFEATYPDLGGVGTPEYEYSIGNLANTMAINLPLTDKATVTFGFVGTDTEPFTQTQKTGGADALLPLQTTAFNTSSDIGRLRITEVDETGLTTCFKELTLTLGNQVTPEKCLGTLGAFEMNTGLFTVDLEAQILFTSSDVVAAIRNNTTVTMDFILTNDNGAMAIDIPAMTLGGGDKEFPVNESVLLNLTGQAFGDATLGTSIGISLFPIVP